MQLKHIEYFVKTSTYKSFNEAAKNLFISQPSLSAAIATLEQELGYPLFTRHKSGITLTPEGEKILPQAKQMLEMQKEWLSLATHPSRVQGKINIIAPEILCSTILLDVILKSVQQYPALQISLREGPPDNIPSTNSNHFLSLGLSFYEPADFEAQKELLAKIQWELIPIADFSTRIFLNTLHPLAQEKGLYLEQLSQFSLVTYDHYARLPHAEVFSYFSKKQIIKLPTREIMYNFILKNPNCIGFFSSICASSCSYIKDGMICTKPILDYPTPLKLALQFPQDRKNDILLRVITELLQESVDILKTAVID